MDTNVDRTRREGNDNDETCSINKRRVAFFLLVSKTHSLVHTTGTGFVRQEHRTNERTKLSEERPKGKRNMQDVKTTDCTAEMMIAAARREDCMARWPTLWVLGDYKRTIMEHVPSYQPTRSEFWRQHTLSQTTKTNYR
mmetsp:Transcript_20861/g.30947  ORF Transcript_20861/g.30947 Transcript_20861/m.30947 type:complete len:139 (+) Transcript_20861:716-1132(+)